MPGDQGLPGRPGSFGLNGEPGEFGYAGASGKEGLIGYPGINFEYTTFILYLLIFVLFFLKKNQNFIINNFQILYLH